MCKPGMDVFFCHCLSVNNDDCTSKVLRLICHSHVYIVCSLLAPFVTRLAGLKLRLENGGPGVAVAFAVAAQLSPTMPWSLSRWHLAAGRIFVCLSSRDPSTSLLALERILVTSIQTQSPSVLSLSLASPVNNTSRCL